MYFCPVIMANPTEIVPGFYSHIAQTGFAAPALYDRYRPSYHHESVEHLLSSLRIAGKACILELGAGTGKLTEKLSSYSAEFRIIAVEPHHEMRAFLKQKSLRNVLVKDGFAQCIPVSSEAVDCVLIAQVGRKPPTSTRDFCTWLD